MPHLVQMDKEYRTKGLKIVAAEVRDSSKDTIAKIIEENKAGFSITKGASGPVPVGGLPHVVAFGADGKLVFQGNPENDKFEAAVKKALKSVKVVAVEVERPANPPKPKPGDVIEERTWTNSEGVKMVAAVTKIEGDKVTFRLKKNQKIVPYPIENLSEEDQNLIKKAAGGE